jgi:hypothetical protein
MRRIAGMVLTVTGVLSCPCQLVVTVPLLTGLLAGTALGSFLTHQTGLIYTAASIYFVGALTLGTWYLLGQPRRPHQADEPGNEPPDDTGPSYIPSGSAVSSVASQTGSSRLRQSSQESREGDPTDTGFMRRS